MSDKRTHFWQLYISAIFQAIALTEFVLFGHSTSATPKVHVIVMGAILILSVILSFLFLTLWTRQFKKHIIPDKYITPFVIATAIPGIILRIGSMLILFVLNPHYSGYNFIFMPIFGSLVYYIYLARRKVLFGFKIFLINAITSSLFIICIMSSAGIIEILKSSRLHLEFVIFGIIFLIIDSVAAKIVALCWRRIQK